jgi:hypothetical protein
MSLDTGIYASMTVLLLLAETCVDTYALKNWQSFLKSKKKPVLMTGFFCFNGKQTKI